MDWASDWKHLKRIHELKLHVAWSVESEEAAVRPSAGFLPRYRSCRGQIQTPRVRCLAVVTRRWSVMTSNLPFRQENWRTPTTVLFLFFCFFIYCFISGVYIYKRTSDHTSFRGSTHLPRKFGDHISLPASLCQPTLAIMLRFPSLYSNERLWSHFLFERTHKRTLVIILLFQRLCTNEH